jgi:hypothetical protein
MKRNSIAKSNLPKRNLTLVLKEKFEEAKVDYTMTLQPGSKY